MGEDLVMDFGSVSSMYDFDCESLIDVSLLRILI